MEPLLDLVKEVRAGDEIRPCRGHEELCAQEGFLHRDIIQGRGMLNKR